MSQSWPQFANNDAFKDMMEEQSGVPARLAMRNRQRAAHVLGWVIIHWLTPNVVQVAIWVATVHPVWPAQHLA